MSGNGVVRSFTTADGRKVLSINPEAMRIAKDAAKGAMARKPETVEGKTVGTKRDSRD